MYLGKKYSSKEIEVSAKSERVRRCQTEEPQAYVVWGIQTEQTWKHARHLRATEPSMEPAFKEERFSAAVRTRFRARTAQFFTRAGRMGPWGSVPVTWRLGDVVSSVALTNFRVASGDYTTIFRLGSPPQLPLSGGGRLMIGGTLLPVSRY